MDRPGWIEVLPNISVPISSIELDTEGRLSYEPFGFFIFAWKPRKCRNGRWRWLCWLEHHDDGTYTLGNRAG